MYLAKSYSPFALPPSAYVDEGFALREREEVLRSAWYPVATADQLKSAGSNVVAEYLGIPIVVRNFGDQLVAMRNVCAHRGCPIADRNSVTEKFRCPYHGWEYGHDGLTRKIPEAKNFPHFDREAHRLEQFPLERCGDLWFVRLSDEGLSLQDYLGPDQPLFAERLSAPTWAPTMTDQVAYEANWKIPIEGSLESYHVPFVHPGTFGNDPGETSSEHVMADYGTKFITSFRSPSLLTQLEDWAIRRLGSEPTGVYQHHHIFPNLMITVMDTLTLVMVVSPTGVDSSRGFLWQFGRQPQHRWFFNNNTAYILGKIAAKASLSVLEEDRPVFNELQTGVAAAAIQPTGSDFVLGRCEERLHAFQSFVAAKLDIVPEGHGRPMFKSSDKVDGNDNVESKEEVVTEESHS